METVNKIGLDTNIFMGIFPGEKDKIEQSLSVLALIHEGVLEGVVSCISLIEIATLFYQRKEEQKAKKAVSLIKSLPNTTIVDVTSDTALLISQIKVSEKLSIADATVLTAAIELSADAFLTFDEDFINIGCIPCMKPGDYIKLL